jgi:uncharacterized protein YccT (UPF0319 family)
MDYQIASATITQTTPFPNSVAIAQSNPAYCGANLFSFSPILTFLTGSGNTISVSSSNLTDIGVHTNITVTVSLADYPSVSSISSTFTVTISCVVTTLTLSTPPLTTTF